jgi:hypothetical protein
MEDHSSVKTLLRDSEFTNSDIDSMLDNLKKRSQPISNKDRSTFNIFTSISDIYYRENLHSDILKNIFDPNTPDIGDLLYLNTLVDIINQEANLNLSKFSHKENVKIIREHKIQNADGKEGGIDIFIYDKTIKQCIIIENKIYNAKDMDNQLGRYFEYASKYFERIAIVYLPLLKNKMPPFELYNDHYREYIPEIKKRLVVLSAEDLFPEYLAKCLNQVDMNNKTAFVYVHHYLKLVEMLGGYKMRNETDRMLLKKMYANEANYNSIECLAEIWKNRTVLAGGIISEELEKLNFESRGPYFLKGIKNTDTFLIFKTIGEDPSHGNSFLIGIAVKTKDATVISKAVDALKKEFVTINLSTNIWENIPDKNHNVQCVYYDFYEHFTFPIDDMIEKIIGHITSLQNKVENF